MRDIYTALGSPALLAMINRATAPGCLVEQAVNAALNQAFEDAEALLLARLGQVTLAMLNAGSSRAHPCPWRISSSGECPLLGREQHAGNGGRQCDCKDRRGGGQNPHRPEGASEEHDQRRRSEQADLSFAHNKFPH